MRSAGDMGSFSNGAPHSFGNAKMSDLSFPAVTVVLVFKVAVGMAGDLKEAFGISVDRAFPPHAADGSALQIGDFVKLDALGNVTVAAENEFEIVGGQHHAELEDVADEALAANFGPRTEDDLIPDAVERYVGDHDDGRLFAGFFEVVFEPGELVVINPAFVFEVAFLTDAVENDEVPASVIKALVSAAFAVAVREEFLAVVVVARFHESFFGPATDVMIADGVVGLVVEVFHGLVPKLPLGVDAVTAHLKGVHDEITASDGKVGFLFQCVGFVEAGFDAFDGTEFWLNVGVCEKGETEGLGEVFGRPS